MKVLGDQAVADPSKIEKKVMEQVQARVTNHEMRNLARKLTPQVSEDEVKSEEEEGKESFFFKNKDVYI
jgi:U4/U6 small nuclear ribonucleoprotein PRP3